MNQRVLFVDDEPNILEGIQRTLRKQVELQTASSGAEALRLMGRLPEAIDAYRRAGEYCAGSRNWLVAGLLLASDRKTDDALHCLLRAHKESPDDEQVIDSLITTYFNSNRHNEAVEFARDRKSVV